MTTSDGSTLQFEDDLRVEDDRGARCVMCAAPLAELGCCSFACVREARRELDDNVVRLRQLQSSPDGPAATRSRLIERNGRLTAALLGWRQ